MSYYRRPWGLYLFAALVYLFLFAPLFTVVINSFNANKSLVGWGGFTLHWFHEAWTNEFVVEGAKNSLFIAAVVTGISAILGTSASLALQRSRRWTRAMIDGTTYARIIIPAGASDLPLAHRLPTRP